MENGRLSHERWFTLSLELDSASRQAEDCLVVRQSTDQTAGRRAGKAILDLAW